MADLTDFRAAYRRRVSLAVRDTAPRLRSDLRENALNRTGRMAGAIRVDPDGAYELEVTVAVPYASYTRPPGTRPHVIRGNPFLAFFWPKAPGGPADVVFAKVNHPGFQPTEDWYGDVVDRWPEMLDEALANSPLD